MLHCVIMWFKKKTRLLQIRLLFQIDSRQAVTNFATSTMMCTAEIRFNTIGVQKVAVSNKRTYDMHIRICGLSSPERKASCKIIFGSSSSESQNFTITSEYNISSSKYSSVFSKEVRKLLQDCYQNKTAMSPISWKSYSW